MRLMLLDVVSSGGQFAAIKCLIWGCYLEHDYCNMLMLLVEAAGRDIVQSTAISVDSASLAQQALLNILWPGMICCKIQACRRAPGRPTACVMSAAFN